MPENKRDRDRISSLMMDGSERETGITVRSGDWYPNLEKLPDGIAGLSRKIEEMGLKFGLWFEPEMVNKDSDLFREHPDWLLADLRRNYCHSRNQYILDFSKKEVVDRFT